MDLELVEGIFRVGANAQRPVAPRQAREQLPQPRYAVLGRGLVAVQHLHVQDQTQTGDEIDMVGVRGAPRLVRVVAFDRTLLMPVERLDRHVGIENPGHAQLAALSRLNVFDL